MSNSALQIFLATFNNMIISYFLLFIVIRSNRTTGFVGCSTVETNYNVDDEHRLCVNCSHCENKNNNAKYAIEFCLPNKNCTVLDCCTCKYHCVNDSWTEHKKCQSKIIETNQQAPRQNHDDSSIFSSYNFLPLILLIFIISLIVFYWRKSRNYCRDLKEKTFSGPNEIQADNSHSPTTPTFASAINREELSYDIIPLNFDLDDLEYDDHHASLFKTTSSFDDVPPSSFDDVPPSSFDDKQATKINNGSPRRSVTLSFDSNDAKSDILDSLSFTKSPFDELPPSYREEIVNSILRPSEMRNVPANDFSFAHDYTD